MKQDLLADLNEEQKAAVTHPGGPLLIVAGAGTGKTTVITRRIAWLIHEHLAKPNEILALTFTDKAAGEMEARVDQLLPYGYTDTQISTFHSFGDRMLREHALDLGLPPEFRVLGEAEQELFLSERFDEIENLTELRPVSNPLKYISICRKVIGRAKDELVTPEQYQEAAAKLLKHATDENEQKEGLRQQEIAQIYSAYENFKAEAGVIDFGDQILLLIKLLKSEPKILESLKNQYRFILVDEFQDTNIAQYELVKLLLHKEQNITVVGDDDQSIYKFRGAAISNIMGFLKDFPAAQTIVLTQNYRSTQPILDAAYSLIQHNNPDRLESRLMINKKLTGRREGELPHFAWYEHEADELDALVEQIRELVKIQPLNEIAILVRSNTTIPAISSALKRAGINYSASSDRGFVDLPEIRGVIAFMHTLVHPNDSLAIVKLMFSPYYKFEPNWVLTLNDLARKSTRDVWEVLENDKSAFWGRLPDEAKVAFKNFRSDLIRYRLLIGRKNPGEILYQFLNDRGILTLEGEKSSQLSLFAALSEPERISMVQNIAAIFEAIKRYGEAGRDPFALTFVDQLDSLIANIVPPAVDLGPDVDAVRIMTVHAAKGLEFKTVFLPSLVSERFPARRRYEGLSLPAELINETLPTGDEHLEEERRLFYVALTRAKTNLFLSGSAHVGDGVRTKKASPFIFECLGITDLPEPIKRLSSANRIHIFASALLSSEPAPKTARLPEYDGTLFLSPAMIETYLADPYQFYWRYVIKAPSAPSRHLIYGNAIHAAIEAYYHLRKQGRLATTETILNRFKESWKSEGFLSKADEARQFSRGEQTLTRFVKRAADQPLPAYFEEEFILTLPGLRIRGRMDAIFQETKAKANPPKPEERSGEIRDFKTSQVADQKEANQKIKENIPIKIYALAYQKRFGELPKLLTLDFVEHDLTASLEPSEAMLGEITNLINEAAANIRAGHFDPNPNNPFKDY